MADLQACVDALLTRAHGDPATVAIGLEVPRGALVELLVERGFAVYAINPKQMTGSAIASRRRGPRMIGATRW